MLDQEQYRHGVFVAHVEQRRDSSPNAKIVKKNSLCIMEAYDRSDRISKKNRTLANKG